MNIVFKTIRKTRQVVVDQMLKHVDNVYPSVRILEPSAGSGNLVDGILNEWPWLEDNIDCVELNSDLRKILELKKFNVVGSDFMKFTPEGEYDYVIAAPTYKNNVDVEHIIKMYECTKDGGKVISLTHPAWTTGKNENQKTFRKWLEDKNYYMMMLEDGSFVENFDTQPSMIIVIHKKEND